MNVKAVFLFSALLVFIGFSPVYGQRVEDSLFNNLASVQLIVRLPSQEKTIDALKASLANPELSDLARKRLQNRLQDLILETDQRNKAIVQAFRFYFDALPLGVVYDTTHYPAKADFLNEELKPIGSQLVKDRVIQLRFGRPFSNAGGGPESMVLADSRLQDLGYPFPKPLIMTGIGFGINKLLAPDMAFQNLLENRVKKLDRKLKRLLP